MKLIIFDLDDTLTDNKLLDFESFRYLSKNFGLYVPKKSEIVDLRHKSLLAKDIILWMIDRSSKLVPIESCIQIRKKFLQEQESQGYIRLKPNLRWTLRKLKSMGLKLIIVTARTNTSSLQAFLEKRKLTQYFANVYDSNCGAKGTIYKKILCDLKISPSECLVVANTPEDLLPAIGLGMNGLGIMGSYGFDPTFEIDLKVITDLSELIKCIDELKQ